MPYKDHYDLELSCASEAAQLAYSTGIDTALRFDTSGITELNEAISEDPDFAMAHAALGRQLQIYGLAHEAEHHSQMSVSLKSHATSREKSAIDVIAASMTSAPESLSMALGHIDRYPTDIFVLSQLLGPFGLLAFSGQRHWREQILELLDATRKSYPGDDWWHLTTSGFAKAELGDLQQAREDAERAWLLCESGNCAHSLAHVHFECGAWKEAATFIKDWDDTHGRHSDMRHHLLWHLALLDCERGGITDDLIDLYGREFDAAISDPMPLTTFSDNASLLWRCKLAGVVVPDELCEDLQVYAETHYPKFGFTFADIHRVMSVALRNDSEQQQDLLRKLTDLSHERGSDVVNCMLEYARGFKAFADEDYAAAVTILDPVISDSVLLGGSNPQRRIIEETFREAQKRAAL